MNSSLRSGLVVILTCSSVSGESLNDQFTALQERRQKAVNEATAAIDKKFAENAKQLLAKAVQAGDLDTAAKIRNALSPAAAPASAPSTPQPSSAKTGESSKTRGKDEILRQLVSSSWESRGAICNFGESGEFKMGDSLGTYGINGDGSINIHWSTGWVSNLKIADDFKSMTESNGDGNSYERVPKNANPPAAQKTPAPKENPLGHTDGSN